MIGGVWLLLTKITLVCMGACAIAMLILLIQVGGWRK